VLRLYAPDAPYNADQLRDIFQFFIVQISQNLKLAPRTTRPLAPSKRGNDSSSQSTLNSNARITEIPYFTEYCYLIDNLANIKSVVLVVDVPGAEELITTYFEELVDCVR
jgi:sister-chromatid-cohesion protein PDS5